MAGNSHREELHEYLDSETGEKRGLYVEGGKISRDAETGEPEMEERVLRRKRFQVPVKCLEPGQETRTRKGKPRRKTIHAILSKKQEIRSNVVKEFVVCKRRNMSPIVLMLPTLFLCPAWASILCLLGEACMHMWSHRRNSRKKNGNVEYRSPFHVISSQFCIHCRMQRWMEKISKIQEKRTLRRKVIYPNPRRKAVS